jgi:hypothetical protein
MKLRWSDPEFRQWFVMSVTVFVIAMVFAFCI